MSKKLTVKYLAMRVAVLENAVVQILNTGVPIDQKYLELQNNMLNTFGPVMDYNKVVKLIAEQEKVNIKKERKRTKADLKKAEKKIQKQVKKEIKADKKIAKMTKTKTPKKGKKYNMPPVDLAPQGHPGHDQH